MKNFLWHIVRLMGLVACLILGSGDVMCQEKTISFYQNPFTFELGASLPINLEIETDSIGVQQFYQELEEADYQPLVQAMLVYREKEKLNDWLYFQLIRRVAQTLMPKEQDYTQYSLYKWFLLCKSGFDTQVAVGNQQIILYIRNKEDISDIPFFMIQGKQYTCLNYHDYGKQFAQAGVYHPVPIAIPEATGDFSYKITHMPDFKPEDYTEKKIKFKYNQKAFHFKLKLNKEIDDLFKNYPGVNFESYFNIPLSTLTYESLVPVLKENLKDASTEQGVDYLMRFTRYSFLYENDDLNFGKEKRLSPEQTLINNYSDCDDRVALFFYLVKELYNLPMVAVMYPTHITLAIEFDEPKGETVFFEGKHYTICEPTPQGEDLGIGETTAALKNLSYQIVYNYDPNK